MPLLPKGTIVEPLDVYDFVIQGLEKNIGIERKSFQDFMLSAHDRLWEQLRAMANTNGNGGESYEPYLLLEGQYMYDAEIRKPVTYTTYFKRHPDQEITFYSTLYAVSAFKVRILISKDKEGTALFLTYLNDKLGKPKEKKELPMRTGFKKDWDMKTKKIYVLEAFGHETGKALLGEYGTFANMIAQTNETEKAIKDISDIKLPSGRRIGDKKAKEIYDVLWM